MKLNIGSSEPGGKYKRGWINIDCEKKYKKHGVIPASGTALPFKDQIFDTVHAVHVLEHIPRRVHPDFFSECYRVLKSSGKLIVEVPDFLSTCENVLDTYSRQEWEQLRCWTLSVYGKHRHKGDAHCWGFYHELLIRDFKQAGFQNVSLLGQDDYISTHYTQEPVLVVRGER